MGQSLHETSFPKWAKKLQAIANRIYMYRHLYRGVPFAVEYINDIVRIVNVKTTHDQYTDCM